MTGKPRRSAAARGRAAARAEFTLARTGRYDAAALAEAMAARLLEERPELAEAGPGAARAFPVGNLERWVPIGPSVVAQGPRSDAYTRATGRIRDLRVSDDGRRAYAAAARGGLWYSDDAGGLWRPVGGWAERSTGPGGTNNAQACGSLSVAFGSAAADDFVMVGTGELHGLGRPPARPNQGGVGVLAARGPATAGPGADPWEPEVGRSLLLGLGCFALARDPAAVPGRTSGAGLDRVLVGTSGGLFLGTRRPAAGPHFGEFTWTALPDVGRLIGLPVGKQPFVTDVLWLPGGANGRIVVALARGVETVTLPAPTGSGVAFSDNGGAKFDWVAGLDPSPAAGNDPVIGRMSLARVATVPPAPAPDRVYVLGERRPAVGGDRPAVWRIDPMSAPAPSASPLTGVPDVWTRNKSTKKNQRDYDQAIAVDDVGGTDRVFLCGNYFGNPASVWCQDVTPPALALGPATGVSRAGPVAAGGDGANPAGLIGNGIHPDVHVVRFAGAPPNRQVWIGTDGGVFVSTQSGRVHSYAPRVNGLAALEVNFCAPHPTSSHFVGAGNQDNGRQLRVGDVVWQDVLGGDGGGVAFHPVATQFFLAQYTFAAWHVHPASSFVAPLQGADTGTDRESAGRSAFYSGPAFVPRAPGSRLAIGTNRVWLTDDFDGASACTWKALPFPGGRPRNPRPAGADAAADQDFGVPVAPPPAAAPAGGDGPLGPVVTLKWLSPTVLVVVFLTGVVRWTEDTVTGDWLARVLVAPPGVATGLPAGSPTAGPHIFLSDVAPVAGTGDFYLITTGDPAVPATETCLYYHEPRDEFFATGLRATFVPVDPGYAGVVDPAVATDVYVGTVTGVWRGRRGAGPPATGAVWPHDWATRVNGLPQSLVQDLHVWHDPAGGPRLLRAATQSRGVWEMDLAAAPATGEPQRTYLRVHAADDRRRLPTPLKDPRKPPGLPATPTAFGYASPDIMLRPRPDANIRPSWPLKANEFIGAGVIVPEYELWTFQTAFRWHRPSVVANGKWTDGLGELIAHYRSTKPALAPAEPKITKAVWDDVVRGTRLTAAGAISADPADPLAVYRPPWQTPAALDAVPTELDLLETVRMPRLLADQIPHVYREDCTVDVLIHHRDTNQVPSGGAFAFLFWRTADTHPQNLAADTTSLRAYVTAAVGGNPPPALTAGWTDVRTAGSAQHFLGVELDARMPRAVSIPFDSRVAPSGRSLLLVAVAGSSADLFTQAPVGLGATAGAVDLVRGWPYAAARLFQAGNRR